MTQEQIQAEMELWKAHLETNPMGLEDLPDYWIPRMQDLEAQVREEWHKESFDRGCELTREEIAKEIEKEAGIIWGQRSDCQKNGMRGVTDLLSEQHSGLLVAASIARGN